MASLLAYVAVLAVVVCGAQNALAQIEKDQAEILNCVHSVLSDEELGHIDIIGVSGFPLLDGSNPVAAGGRFGKGRVIGFGHDQFLKKDEKSERSSNRVRFMDNLWAWILPTKQGAKRSVGVVSTQIPSLMSSLTWKPQYGMLSAVKAADVASTKADVLIIDQDFDKDYAYALVERVRQGMSVVILANNWYFVKYYSNQDQFNYGWAPNIVAVPAGFQFRHSTDAVGNGKDRVSLTPAVSYQCKGKRG